MVHHSLQRELNRGENFTGSGRNMIILDDYNENLDTTTITEPITTNTTINTNSPSTSQHLFTKLFIYFSCILLLILLCFAIVNIRKSVRKKKMKPSLPVINNKIREEQDAVYEYNQIHSPILLQQATLQTIYSTITETEHNCQDLVRVEI